MRRRNQRRFAGIATMVAAFALLAGTAGAYSNPYNLAAGAAGGPPTRANGSRGTSSTSAGVTALGYAIAGDTPLSLLNAETFSLTVRFPRAGVIYARMGIPGGPQIADGFTGRANVGIKPLGVSFSAVGRQDLFYASELGKPLTITLKFAFQPNVGRTEYSTSTITTAA